MNRHRRAFVAQGLVRVAVVSPAIVMLTTACSTPEPAARSQTYTERVSTLLISQDKRQLVILGERYHYVFAAPADIVGLMASPLKRQVSVHIEPFHVQLDGRTTGRYTLNLPATLTEAEVAQAEALGFQQDSQGGWRHDSMLEGKRFIQGNTLRIGRTHEALSRTYTVTVEAEETPGEKVAQDLATPISATADGMLMVYFAVLVPVLIPLIFLAREKRPALSAAASAPAR